MPFTPAQLFAFFDSHAIAHETVNHPPIFTVEEGKEWRGKIPGMHCKNLFLKDKKGALWLIVMPAEKRADLASIARQTGAVKFSFGKPDLLLEKLGVTPGSVTPFAVLNDAGKSVCIALDRDMMQSPMVNFHPLHNAASTVISTQDLTKFRAVLGRDPVIIDTGSWADSLHA